MPGRHCVLADHTHSAVPVHSHLGPRMRVDLFRHRVPSGYGRNYLFATLLRRTVPAFKIAHLIREFLVLHDQAEPLGKVPGTEVVLPRGIVYPFTHSDKGIQVMSDKTQPSIGTVEHKAADAEIAFCVLANVPLVLCLSRLSDNR